VPMQKKTNYQAVKVRLFEIYSPISRQRATQIILSGLIEPWRQG
jgi:hypothetical protein